MIEMVIECAIGNKKDSGNSGGFYIGTAYNDMRHSTFNIHPSGDAEMFKTKLRPVDSSEYYVLSFMEGTREQRLTSGSTTLMGQTSEAKRYEIDPSRFQHASVL